MESRNCPICTNPYPCKTIDLPEPADEVGHNVMCSNCGLVYHNPVMTEVEMLRYYRDEFSSEYHESKAMQVELAQQRLQTLKKHVNLSMLSPALEIGCAYGDFVMALNDAGIDASGIEASETLSRVAREDRKANVMTASLESAELPSKHYGLIALFHVLEHFRDPMKALNIIRESMSDQAVLYVEVPTVAETQLAQVFKMIHPTTFVPETLQLMLHHAGFAVESVKEQGYNLIAIARKVEKLSTREPVTNPDAIFQKVSDYIALRQNVLQRINDKMSALKTKKNIAVYGAGHNTIDLNELFPLADIALSGIYDADPNKQGKALLGKVIAPPEALSDFNGDAVIISTYKFQEEVCKNLQFLQQRGVELITLYDKP